MGCNIYTLKLDAAYQPIEIIEGLKGFSMVYTGRARALENHSEKLSALFYYPSIIVLNNYIRKKTVYMSPTRMNIYWRDKYMCQYCKGKFPQSGLTLDHVIPRSRGGQKTWENIVACCYSCNQKKGNKTPPEASMPLIKEPTVPRFNVLRTVPNIQIPLSWKNFI
jgi:5-methylcytosine-specific restriction endonuclease McrA